MPDEKPNWIAIRTAYVVKGWSASKCAAEFSTPVDTIKRHASKEKWNAERHRTDTGVNKAAADAAAQEAREAVQKAAAEKAKTDRELVNLQRAAVEDAITIRDSLTGADRLVANSAIVLMVTRAIGTGRTVDGMTHGQPSGTGDLDNPGVPNAAKVPAASDLDGDNTAAPMRRFVVKIHQPPVLTVVPDQQAAG